jgi:predicted molibdopterin-dependent oxidoreductase YjgC
MTNSLNEMDQPDVYFCIGTNMTECHPVAATRIKKGVRNGSKLIVADPRKIPLAEKADIYLQLKPGTDAALLLAMAHVIEKKGLTDLAFIENRTQDYEFFRAHLIDKTPQWAESITGVKAELIEEAAEVFGTADRAGIYYTLGITEHISGTENVQCLCNLVLMTGNIGKEGTGINPMRGQNNVQGAGDAGAVPAMYPGYQAVSHPSVKRKFSELYGGDLSDKPGINKIQAFESCGESIHAMLIDGENSLISEADRIKTESSLRSLSHLVVADIFLTETAKLADVVLPASAWAETEGSCTNTERRIQRLRKAVEPQGESQPDWWIIAELAKRMGFSGFEYNNVEEIFNEICSVSPIYAGLTWDKMSTGKYQWPVPEQDHSGTPYLHEGSFTIGRAAFKKVEYRPPGEVVSEQFPYWLTTGRRLSTYHTNTQTGRASGFDFLVSEETLEMHPGDMKKANLRANDLVEVSSPRGSVVMKLAENKNILTGVVFSSFAFSETPVNVLTGGGYDLTTQTPEYKVCPVNIKKHQ